MVCDEPTFRVTTVVLEHRTPSLAFAIEEVAHVNVWKNRLRELGLPVGPWLRALKRAVLEDRPDDHPISIGAAGTPDIVLPLRQLRDAVTITPGQKIAYVADATDTPAIGRQSLASFKTPTSCSSRLPLPRRMRHSRPSARHLTTVAAGECARAARVRRVEPFHFSPRYSEEEERMLAEVMTAFSGQSGEEPCEKAIPCGSARA